MLSGAPNLASKFPSQSFESPKASNCPKKSSYMQKPLQKKKENPTILIGGLIKPAKSYLLEKPNGNEYISTAEKKEKYKMVSKALATKLAFKNLKATLFKNHDAWQPFHQKQI